MTKDPSKPVDRTDTAFEPYGPQEGSDTSAGRKPIEVFRKALRPGERKHHEREQRIKFEVLDKEPSDERNGFDPYNTLKKEPHGHST